MLAILNGERPPQPTHPTFTEDLWKLTQRCWDHDPSIRPKILGVLQVLAQSRTLAADERISLVTTIFSDDDQVKMIGHISGDDAQTFIDLIYEVSPRKISHLKDRLIGSHSDLHILSLRHWIVFRQRSTGGVSIIYSGFAATSPWFHDR